MITNLTGSEKQIKWATDIHDEWVRQINNVIKNAQSRVDRDNMPQMWVDVTIQESKKTLDKIERIKKASTFIEKSYLHIGDLFFKMTCEAYKKANKHQKEE